MTDRAPMAPDAVALSRRAFLGLAGATLVAGCSGTGRNADSLATVLDVPSRRLYFGASTPTDMLPTFERELGQTLSCYRSFFLADEVGDLVARAREDVEAGRMPIVSIKPPSSWSETADDAQWIDSIVVPLAELGHSVVLAVHHEPEDDSEQYGEPADYKAMQESVINRAAAAGHTITVAPILMSWTFDERSGRVPSDWFVDKAAIFGLDHYNPWSATNGAPWQPFEPKMILAHKAADGRPLVVGEYGCRSDPTRPGRAAHWMREAFAVARETGVVAMSYFNSGLNSPDGTWELDAETLPVFVDQLSSRAVVRS